MGTNTLDEFLIGLRNYYGIPTQYLNLKILIRLFRYQTSLCIKFKSEDNNDPMIDDKGSIVLRVDPRFFRRWS